MMEPNAKIFRSLELVVDTAAYRAELDGRALTLEPKAFDLLLVLLSHPGHLVTKRQLLDEVWPGTAVTENALTRVVAQLRRALGDDAHAARFLETVPTKGYRWLAPVTVGSDWGQSGVRPGSDPGRMSATGWRRAAIGICLGAAAVAGLAWLGSGAAREDSTTILPRQATLSSGLDVYPALSPDGRRLAYSSDRSGGWEIYIKDLEATTEERPLTSDGQQNLHAAWSPDGRRIAFHSARRGGIWIVAAEGGEPTQVSSFGSRPAWAPDSRRLAFQSEHAADIGPAARAANLPSTIWIADTAGGQPKPLTRRGIPAGGHGAPAWSPDGRHVAFATADFALSEVWAVDLVGGEPYRLSGDRAPAYDPAYLPDGRSLLFAAGPRLWRVTLAADGRPASQPRAMAAAGIENLRHFTVSRTGRVAVAGLSLRTGLWSAPVDAAGRLAAEPRPITDDTRPRNSLAQFSPDGRRIALMSAPAGRLPDIWVMNADGSGIAPVTNDQHYDAAPDWMPDARRVTFKSVRDGRVGLWEVDVETKQEARLIDFGLIEDVVRQQGLIQDAELSPDGTLLTYALLDPGTATKALYVRPLRGGDAIRLTSGDPPASYPAWSPDGRWIACELQETDGAVAAVVPAGGGMPRRLTSARGHSWVHSWSPDSRRILFAGQRDGVWNVYWVDREGGPEHRITANTRVSNFIRYPAWSPKGDQIVFEYGDLRGNIWVLDLR